ncbi:MAG TPA: hypothetical protein VNK41_11460 [Vicinamibacterales bacterium]|nr:hypothetical protein [Vicinamibacterales bacterium]
MGRVARALTVRLTVKALVMAALLALPDAAQAQLTPTWENATTDTGSFTDFDTGTLTFPPITASEISIVSPGGAYYHDHDAGGSMTLEVRLDGVWTLVFTGPVSNDTDIFLSSLASPVATFPAGQVDGVRLSSTVLPINDAFHEFPNDMQFLLALSVPTMSEWLIFTLAFALALAGAVALRWTTRVA